MTDIVQSVGEFATDSPADRRGWYQSEEFRQLLRRRYASEDRFRILGIAAIVLAAVILLVLLASIVAKGYPAFVQTEVRLDVTFEESVIDPSGSRDERALSGANYQRLIRSALQDIFPDATGRRVRRQLTDLVSIGAAFQLRDMVMSDPSLIGQTRELWVLASDDIDQFLKGNIACGTEHAARLGGQPCTVPENERRVNDRQVGWVDQLIVEERIRRSFNTVLFSAGDSREPELAGILGGVVGSLYTLLVCLLMAVPVGVAAAVYLEEFAPRNRWTGLIEVNINNLAAVPSIVFGLLGLSVLLNFFGLPRSAPLVGGIVLALMTLPTVIIASRAALKAVPPSIRDAALGVGASPYQVVSHHVLPLAAPGILTGTIIGMAQALGETAPLMMVGMIAFIVDIPAGFTDSATVLPVQIYMWSDSPERAFTERTSAAIMVLLGFLIAMNAVAIYLRKRFERRW